MVEFSGGKNSIFFFLSFVIFIPISPSANAAGPGDCQQEAQAAETALMNESTRLGNEISKTQDAIRTEEQNKSKAEADIKTAESSGQSNKPAEGERDKAENKLEKDAGNGKEGGLKQQLAGNMAQKAVNDAAIPAATARKVACMSGQPAKENDPAAASEMGKPTTDPEAAKTASDNYEKNGQIEVGKNTVNIPEESRAAYRTSAADGAMTASEMKKMNTTLTTADGKTLTYQGVQNGAHTWGESAPNGGAPTNSVSYVDLDGAGKGAMGTFQSTNGLSGANTFSSTEAVQAAARAQFNQPIQNSNLVGSWNDSSYLDTHYVDPNTGKLVPRGITASRGVIRAPVPKPAGTTASASSSLQSQLVEMRVVQKPGL